MSKTRNQKKRTKQQIALWVSVAVWVVLVIAVATVEVF